MNKNNQQLKKHFEKRYLKGTCFDSLDDLIKDKSTVFENAPRALIACELLGVWRGLQELNCYDADQYIEFNFIGKSESGKTEIYEVRAKNDNWLLGIIKWNSQWRHYCFYPEHSTLYSDRCMNRIGMFITGLNQKHKSTLSEAKT